MKLFSAQQLPYIPLVCCSLFFKIQLKPQIRMNKIAGENGAIYYPSPAGSSSRTRISITLLGLYLSPESFLNFLAKAQTSPWFWNIFKLMAFRSLEFESQKIKSGNFHFYKTRFGSWPFSQALFAQQQVQTKLWKVQFCSMWFIIIPFLSHYGCCC